MRRKGFSFARAFCRLLLPSCSAGAAAAPRRRPPRCPFGAGAGSVPRGSCHPTQPGLGFHPCPPPLPPSLGLANSSILLPFFPSAPSPRFKNNPGLVAAVPGVQGALQHPLPVMAHGRLQSDTGQGRVTVIAGCPLRSPPGFLLLRILFACQ